MYGIKNCNKERFFRNKLFSNLRPFKDKELFSEQVLLQLAEEELLKREVEIPSLIRTELGLRKSINEGRKLRKLFIDSKLKPIKWLHQARKESLKIKLKKIGNHHLYAILLDYRKGKYPYGIYIGESTYQIETRFLQHKEGVRSALSVNKHGSEILYSIVTHLNFPSNKNRYGEKLEAELVKRLYVSKLKLAGLPSYRIKGGHLFKRPKK